MLTKDEAKPFSGSMDDILAADPSEHAIFRRTFLHSMFWTVLSHEMT
jgi:hypothetical protein